MENIALGGPFLGTGGGSDPYIGKLMARGSNSKKWTCYRFKCG